jgi:MYXO-CTERM domain-containing protein
MCRMSVLIGTMLLATSVFAQEPDTSRTTNPDAYTRDTYTRPVEGRTGSGYGNWGLLGLLGLTGLLGLRRGETIVRGRDEYLNEQRRRVA